MSNLYVYRYLKELRNADRKGVAVGFVSFIFFWIMWSLGYVVGLLGVILGMQLGARLGDLGKISDEEMEELVARMNEEGPNN
tara:strand:- start:2630 stop:2875 length:246 start_codon:yes stop_codon:yes gene_type:complete